MLRRPGHDGHMLIAQLAPGKGLFRLGQLIQLTGDANPLGRRTGGKPALPTKPGNDADRPVGHVLTRPVEAAEPAGEQRFGTVDDLTALDQRLSEGGAFEAIQPGRDIAEIFQDACDRIAWSLRYRNHGSHAAAWLRQLYVATRKSLKR